MQNRAPESCKTETEQRQGVTLVQVPTGEAKPLSGPEDRRHWVRSQCDALVSAEGLPSCQRVYKQNGPDGEDTGTKEFSSPTSMRGMTHMSSPCSSW